MKRPLLPPLLPPLLLSLLVSTFWLTACESGAKSPRGFSLPVGDAAVGKDVFLKYHCLACHSIDAVEDPNMAKQLEVSVHLGGEVTRTTTYAYLVTSVINPSHRLAVGYMPDLISDMGTSKMTNYNDVMTVTELIDLVAFLQPQYELMDYVETNYYMHH